MGIFFILQLLPVDEASDFEKMTLVNILVVSIKEVIDFHPPSFSLPS